MRYIWNHVGYASEVPESKLEKWNGFIYARSGGETKHVPLAPDGHTWTRDGAYPDQLSAEIAMERLAKRPRVVAELEVPE